MSKYSVEQVNKACREMMAGVDPCHLMIDDMLREYAATLATQAAVDELVDLAKKVDIMLMPLASFAAMCNEKLADMGKGYEPEYFGYGGSDPVRDGFALSKKLRASLSNIGPQS